MAAARQSSASSPVRGSAPQTPMDVSQAAAEESRADEGFQGRVAAVSFPAVPGARLTLPGVMDDEGRVDESRLRMHIFKNGRKANAPFFCAPHVVMAALNSFCIMSSVVFVYLFALNSVYGDLLIF